MSLLTTRCTPRRFGRLASAAALVALFALGGGAACKQGEGEVCQIDDDCEDGLECNAGTMRCQQPGADLVDAAPQADAMDDEADAAIADAAVDAATPDAAVDAAVDADTE